jgi:hypothetical protein
MPVALSFVLAEYRFSHMMLPVTARTSQSLLLLLLLLNLPCRPPYPLL